MNNQEIIHKFTSNEEDIKTYEYKYNNVSLYQSGNFYNLYSYSTIIAKRDIKKDIYIISSRSYSNTTSKHQSHLSSAVNGYETIYVHDVNNTNSENIEIFIADIKNMCIKQSRARKSDYTIYIDNLKGHLKAFIDYINIDKRSKLYKEAIHLYNATYDEILIRCEVDIEKAKIQAIKAKKAKQKLNKDRIKFLNNDDFLINALKEYKEAFINDKEFYKAKLTYNSICFDIKDLITKQNKLQKDFLAHKDILRINKKCEVITSQHIRIEKNEAIALYKLVMSKTLKKGDRILSWRFISQNDLSLIVGCHTIAISDIKECYDVLIKCKG